jgi:hypothetical protein
MDGHPLGMFRPGAVIARDGSKEEADKALHHWTHDQVHVGAYDPAVRIGVLDELDAQIPRGADGFRRKRHRLDSVYS